MADRTVGGLYLSLGLDISELEYGFALADRTVKQAVRKFDEEAKHLKIQTDIDTLNAETAIEKLQARYRGLGAEIKNAQDKERLLLRDMQAAERELGKDSAITQRAKTSWLNQQRVIASLQSRQRELKATIDVSTSSMFKFAEAIQAARGGAASLASYLGAAGPAAAAIGAAIGAGFGLASLTKEAADSAAAIGDLGDNLGVSTEEAAQFQGTLVAAGVSVDGFVGWITKLDKGVKSAGAAGNEATRTLERFGASLTDGEGNLLDYNEQLRQLAKAYQNAKSVGKVEDFFAGLGGAAQQYRDLFNKLDSEYGRRGAEMYGKGLQDAAPAAMEVTDRLKELDEKLAQIKLAFGAAFVPVAAEMVPRLVDALRGLLGVLDENKETLFAFARSVGRLAELQINPLGAFKGFKESLDNAFSDIEVPVNDSMLDSAARTAAKRREAEGRINEQTQRERKAALDKEAKAERDNADAIAEIWRKATASKLENDLAAIDTRMKKELEAANLTAEARGRIEQRYAAERAATLQKANQQMEQMNRELSDSIAKQTKGELENALRDIDRQADATRKRYKDLFGQVSAETENLIQQNAELQRQNALQSRADKALTSEKKYWDLFQQAMNGGMVSETFRNGVKMYTMTGNLSREERLQVAEDAIRKAMLKERGIDSANVRTSDLLPFDAIMKKLQGGGLANIVDDAGIMGEKVATAVSTSLQGVTEQMAAGMNAGLAPALDRLTAQDGQYQTAALGQYEAIRQSVDALAARMGDRESVAPVITVQIDSAVTEDSASMTRLCDTVADRINEVLVRYIGDGGSSGRNTY